MREVLGVWRKQEDIPDSSCQTHDFRHSGAAKRNPESRVAGSKNRGALRGRIRVSDHKTKVGDLDSGFRFAAPE